MQETYFITGGNGFIGSRLSQKLIEDGHSIRLWLRAGAQSPVPEDEVSIYRGNLNDIEDMAAAMKGCTGVFHLAAIARITESYPGEIMDVNVEGARSVFRAALKAGVSRVVYTSTAGVFGPSDGNTVSEQSPLPDHYFLNYERSKALTWAVADAFISDGLDIITVHPSRVFGPGPLNESNSVTLLIKQFIEGQWRYMPGKGDKTGNYVFIRDVVNGHLLAMKYGAKGAHYLLGGNDISYSELAETTMKAAGVDYPLKHVPFALMMVLARYYSTTYHLFGVHPKFLPGHVNKYMCDWSVSSERAIREIHYSITPFNEAIEQTVEWLKGSN